MALALHPYTWQNGYAQLAETATWAGGSYHVDEKGERAHYSTPSSKEQLSSTVPNDLGINVLRMWPTLFNGTESPHGLPTWWKASPEVDVLICGGGLFGLEVAISLARQGVSFRIVDKAEAPLLSGRADGVLPRALEILHSWGLAYEVSEEGPLLDSTAVMKDGRELFYNPSSQCDSRYRGIHVITQAQLEKIYIRDLTRHRVIIERNTVIDTFQVQSAPSPYPVQATLKDLKTGLKQPVRAKYLVGADGAASRTREQLNIPFDGNTADIFWAIMDCVFDTDYPHFLDFSVIISAEYGGCIVIPREEGYTRIYTQINGDKARKLAQGRQARRNASAMGETRIGDHGITAEEVLEQTNKIFAPYTVKFASPMSWFSVWKVSERVARFFSSSDLRVHIGGDAAHVHSVLGAFGLNSSIYDASNLGWKLGLSIKGFAKPSAILPTYDQERRLFANRVIRCSGSYLRFICNSSLPLVELRGLGDELETHEDKLPVLDGSYDADIRWLRTFWGRNAQCLLGVEAPEAPSAISAPRLVADIKRQKPTTILNYVRAPNPRVTSYLYDTMTGAARFHIVIFCSDLQGPVRERLAHFSQQGVGPGGFFGRFGGAAMFNIILVIKALPFETKDILTGENQKDDLGHLIGNSALVYDDRPPDEDAHYWYGIYHARGAVVVVRPDLWVRMSAWPEDIQAIENYFAGFLIKHTAEAYPPVQNPEESNVASTESRNAVSADCNGFSTKVKTLMTVDKALLQGALTVHEEQVTADPGGKLERSSERKI